MSRILLVSPYFFPERTGIAVTATDGARFFHELGHDVCVVTAMPFFPQMRVWDEYRGRLTCSENLNGLAIKRVWIYVPGRESTLGRIVHAASFSLSALFRAAFVPCDIMVCTVPFLPSAFVIGMLAKVRRKQLWLSVKDLEIDAAEELSLLPAGPVTKAARAFERLTLRLADQVHGISPRIVARLQELGVEPGKLRLVSDSVDVGGEFQRGRGQAQQGNYFDQVHGIRGKTIFVHAGALAAKHNSAVIVETARRLRHDHRLFFAIFGEGINEREMRERIADHALDNIAVFPLCSRDQFTWMLASADVGVLSMHPGAATATFPSKVLSYTAAGLPILAAVDTDCEMGTLIREHPLGLVVPPDDAPALSEGALALTDSRDLRAGLGESGHAFALDRYDHQSVKQNQYRPLFAD